MALKVGELSLDVTANLAPLLRDIAGIRPPKLGVDADTSRATAAIRALTQPLGQAGAGRLAVTADTARAESAIAGVTRQVRAVANERPRVDVDTRDAERSIGGLGDRIKTALAFGGGFKIADTAFNLLGKGIGGVKDAVFGLNSETENVRASFMAFTKSGEQTDAILAQVRQEADKTPFTFTELSRAVASLMPSAKQSGVALMDLTKEAEILGASHPEQGLEGAAFALREAMSGDFTSIVERFDLPRQYIAELKQQGVPNIEIVRRAMQQMGYDGDLVAAMAQTTSGRLSTFQDAIDGLKRRITAPLFNTLSQGLASLSGWLDRNQVAVQRFADLIGAGLQTGFVIARDAVLTFAQALSGNWTDAPGIVGVHRVVGNLGLVIRDVVFPAVQAFVGFVTDTALPALGQFGQWVMTNVVPALADLGTFLRGTVLPALGDLGTWLQANVLPAVQQFAQWLGQNLPPVLAAIGDYIQTTILPALERFGAWFRSDALPAIQSFAAAVRQFFEDQIVPAIERVASDVLPMLAAAWQQISTEILPTVQAIAEGVQRNFQLVAGFIEAHGAQIQAIISRAWEFVHDTIQNALTVITGVITLAMNLIQGDWSGAWDSIKQILSGVWAIIQTNIGLALEAIKTALSLAWTAIQSGAKGAWDAIAGVITGAWNGLQSFVDGAKDALRAAAIWAWERVRDTVGGVWDAITSAVTGAWNGVQRFVDGARDALRSSLIWAYEQVRDAVGGVWSAISSAVQSAWNGVQQFVDGAKSALKSALLWPYEQARDLVGGVWNTISSNVQSGWNGVATWLDNAKTGVKNAILWPFEQARDAIGGIMGAFKSNLAGPFNSAADGISGFIGHLADAVNWVSGKLGLGDIINKGGMIQIPHFAAGGVAPGGPIIAGERGPELLMPPEGTRVFSKRETVAIFRALGNTGQPQGVPVGLPGQPLGLGGFPGIGDIVGGIRDKAEDAVGAIRDVVSKGAEWLVNQALSTFGVSLDLAEPFAGVGKALFTKLVDGLKSGIADLVKQVKDALPAPPGGGGGGEPSNYPGGNAVLDMALRTPGVYMWCEKFVGDVMQRLGLNYSRAGSAEEHAHMQPLSPGLGPAGAVVFFPWDTYGHVAFSGGNGQIFGTLNTPSGTGWSSPGGWQPYGWTTNPRDKGGWITEPVIGVGLRTGETWSIAERQPEYVVPPDQIGHGGEAHTTVINLGGITVQAAPGADGYEQGRQAGYGFRDALIRSGYNVG
jgi:phage-related protein